MSDVALRMDHVYKKFRKGEIYNSLRDLVPALTGKMFRQGELNSADKREFWALQDVSFEVKQGEALAIIGNNGAGKSTILKILSRIMKPTNGAMVVNGRLSALIEVSAGFHQDLTGRENIYLNGTILGMSKQEIDKKLDRIIAFSGIEEFIDTPVKRYSSGMFARLGFSVAAHVNPDVLIVDEVLSVGDFLFQQKCLKRMKEVLSEGATVLFVSHNLRSVTEFCNRCILLERGRIRDSGPAQDVVSAYLNMARAAQDEKESTGPVAISKFVVRGRDGECIQFQSGQRAWVDVELTAHAPCKGLSVSIFIKDDSFQDVFATSTERLGCGNFALERGQTFTCTFELDLNLAAGTFHFAALVYRYATQTRFDARDPAATIYVSSDIDALGVVNCFPRVTRHEVLADVNVSAVTSR